jgi:hypothetical protein
MSTDSVEVQHANLNATYTQGALSPLRPSYHV